MYDEFERAVTGKPRKGIPVFGWVLIVLAFLFMFGIVGVGVAANWVGHRIEEEFSRDIAVDLADEFRDLEDQLAEELDGLDAEVAAEVADALREVEAELQAEFGEDAPLFAGNLLSRIGPRISRIVGNPAVGLTLLQDIGSSDYSEKALRDVLEGSLRVRTGDGELTADLWRGDDGGSLVIQGADGEELAIDLVKADGGGALVLRSEEGRVEFGAGSQAASLPGWVPVARWVKGEPTPLFSMVSEEGSLGAVAFEADRSPRAVLAYYREALQAEGYRIREERGSARHGAMEGGFWAESYEDDRVVFVAASQEDGVTKVLLGYGLESL